MIEMRGGRGCLALGILGFKVHGKPEWEPSLDPRSLQIVAEGLVAMRGLNRFFLRQKVGVEPNLNPQF